MLESSSGHKFKLRSVSSTTDAVSAVSRNSMVWPCFLWQIVWLSLPLLRNSGMIFSNVLVVHCVWP